MTHYRHRPTRCATSVLRALTRVFGAHHDLPEIANFVADLCPGCTVQQTRTLLGYSLRSGALASEVSPQHRRVFLRAVMHGLRKGRCFKHQIARRGLVSSRRASRADANRARAAARFGVENGTAAPAFDIDAFTTIYQATMGVIGMGIGAATEAENREALAAATEAAGGNAAANQDLLNRYAALLTTNQNAAATAAATGDSGEVERLRMEMAAAQADLERKLAEASEGPSQLAVAGMVVGGLVALGGTAWLISRLSSGNAAMHYGYGY